MKEFRNLMELKDAPSEVFLEIQSIILTTLADMNKMFNNKPVATDPYSVPFEEFLGGNIFLVEEMSDLVDVQFYEGLDYTSVLQGVSEFDVAHYLPSQEFVFMSYVTNDAGGNGYFIPADIVACIPNISDCIARSHEGNSKKTMTFRGPMSEIKRISPLSGKIQTRLIPITPEKYNELVNGDLQIGQFINLTKDEIEFINNGVTSEEYKIIVTPAE